MSDASIDSPGVEIGTTVGTTPSSDAPEQPVTPPAQHRSISETLAKILDAVSKHPAENEGHTPNWKAEQNNAVEAARKGDYEKSLPVLEHLRNDHPKDLSVASDYAAILGWAGRDADAVAAYKSLPEGVRPDYLIDSIGHSYRNLHQPEEALAVYRLGLLTNPTNQSFLAGEILSLLEGDHAKEAKDLALDAEAKYPTPSDPLLTAIKLTLRADAVTTARAGHYKEALTEFAALHKKYPADVGISSDYVAVLSWAGHDAEAVALYRTLPTENQPDYVLDAAAHSYRNLHQANKALALYTAALKLDPQNVTYAVGAIYSLSDLGRSKEAIKMAEEQLTKHPEKPEALVKAYSDVERRYAIDLARAGHFDQALKLLRALRAKYPSDITEQMDIVVVLSWAGRDEEAVKEYQKIERRPAPDYVLEAVGASYRRLGQTEKALVIYRRGAKQSPANAIFAAGEIRCLNELGRYSEGLERAKDFTDKHGERLDVLLGGGESANFEEKQFDALDFYERAQTIAPDNREALRGIIHAEDLMGAARLALDNADKHPGLMKGNEYRAIVGDQDQALVRWGPLESESEDTRYAATDLSLASLSAHINEWSASNDPEAAPNILRARFDRLVALRDRGHMQEVVNEYNQLVHEGYVVPNYAMEPVGEAYLTLREPEIARDIFLKVLQVTPKDFETRRLLAYAYLECNQYDEAYAMIDALREGEPTWLYLKGEPDRQPNAYRATTEIATGELRTYGSLLQSGGLLQGADDRLTKVVQAGPFDPGNRAAAGDLYLARGWPRKALEQYEIGLAIQEGHGVANEVGYAESQLALQNFKEAEAKTQNLMKRFPENLAVQQNNRAWELQNMAEVDVHAGYNFPPTGSTNGAEIPHGQGYNVGAELYSSPIDYNWRLFAGEDFAHEHEPAAEGIVNYSRVNAGVEYRKGDVTVTGAPTYNTYKTHERIGADGTFKYTFNDIWTAGIAAELFSPATPLRALNTGVTANRYDANVLWRQSESRQLSLDAYAMPFSDNNFRTVQVAEYTERLYTTPKLKVDLESSLASSQNSKNENRSYFNPAWDVIGLLGLRATQTLYHRYETLYEHSLLAMPGYYWQKEYGASPAWTVRYEHHFQVNDMLSLAGGVNYTHQNYSGSAEDAVSLTIDAVERF